MTVQIFDRLTRLILISTTVLMSLCYVWELQAAAFRHIAKSETSWVREQKRIRKERLGHKTESANEIRESEANYLNLDTSADVW